MATLVTQVLCLIDCPTSEPTPVRRIPGREHLPFNEVCFGDYRDSVEVYTDFQTKLNIKKALGIMSEWIGLGHLRSSRKALFCIATEIVTINRATNWICIKNI